MWCLAICHDLAGGGAARSALFAKHSEHNIERISAFLLTGPIADADGVSGVGDDPHLVGSLYTLDVATVQEARAIMESDPFMGPVWSGIDYFELHDTAGAWLDPARRPLGVPSAPPCYVAFAAGDPMMEDALFTSRLTSSGTGANDRSTPRSMVVFQAESMAAARERAGADARVVALPVAIGQLVRITSMADIAALRG